MERYKPIRQLMADGEFSKALDHLVRVLQKNPEDKEAKQLEYTCREMIQIQHVCNDTTEEKSEISVEEYLSVHFRRIMKKICHWMFHLLNKLPLQYQQKLKADRFRVWEIHFTLDADSQKDWLWELLFWDTKRRITVFASLIGVILLGIALFLLLAFEGGSDSKSEEQISFSVLIQSAQEGDAQAQYSIGKKYYEGDNVQKDVARALYWLTQSARAGHSQAAALLQKILVEQERVEERKYQWKQNKNKNHRLVGGE
jgi:hypothetical protein